jgi:UDP-glucuronate 4-epimerase
MTTLITGAAGFIGYHASLSLLQKGEDVVGIDNLNAHYDPSLKAARLDNLKMHKQFSFYPLALEDHSQINKVIRNLPADLNIIHLAAQAGVRYSLIDPYAYTASNVEGHLSLLEACRHHGRIRHLVYASTSSVYGANTKLPFTVQDPTDSPISLYAATKKCGELMSHAYTHLYDIPTTGLRYFTVYGPWGRPDMTAFTFTKAILAGEEITVFNHGDMRRNYTYIDDIIDGTLLCLSTPPHSPPKHCLYNIGHHRSESLMDFIHILEGILGKKAQLRFADIQPGDMKETIADIGPIQKDFGYFPKVDLKDGLEQFSRWYLHYYRQVL